MHLAVGFHKGTDEATREETKKELEANGVSLFLRRKWQEGSRRKGAVIHREISLTKALSVSLPNGYFTSLNETVSSGDKGHKAIRYIGLFCLHRQDIELNKQLQSLTHRYPSSPLRSHEA